MKDFLKRYQIDLEVLTPVFIGSGLEVNAKEYIYYQKNYEVWIPNRSRMIRSVIERCLIEQYEQYMLSGREPLLIWMRSVGYKDKEIQNLCDYYLDCSGALIDINRSSDILEFMKDSYGLPYIPGSSIKGAIRSSLLGSRIINNTSEYQSVRRDAVISKDNIDGKINKRYLTKEGKKIEEIGFHILKKTENISDAKNDELKGLSISDSKPLAVKNLTLCQKIDVRVDGSKKSLNVIRECLKPGTVVSFDMTVDTTIFSIPVEKIEKVLKEVFGFYQSIYVGKYIELSKTDKGNLYLGGGSGYGTKTVAYELFNEESRTRVVGKLMNVKYPKHGHRSDAKNGVSPHTLKCTYYDGKLVEIGKCCVKIVAIE